MGHAEDFIAPPHTLNNENSGNLGLIQVRPKPPETPELVWPTGREETVLFLVKQ
jgi:hypothetical protein